MLMFPELKEERDAAEKVKREKPILVILGNPPYDGFAGVAIGEERDLSNAYRTTVKAPAPEGEPDPSIFSTEWNREGIQVGTAITLLVRKQKSNSTNKIRFRNLWGKTKKSELLETTLQEGK